MQKFYVLKDDEGVLRPMAGICQGEGIAAEFGKEELEKKASKTDCTVVLCELSEVEK